MIKFDGINLTYKESNGVKKVLDNVSFTIPNNGFVSLFGKSGSGKTTILNMISGIVKFNSGDIYYDDKKYSEFSSEDYNTLRREKIGLIFQDDNLFKDLTVEENINLSLELQGNSETQQLDYYYDLLGIGEFKKTKVSKLSGGERQRVSILRSLARNASIILADEPTASLDKSNSDIVYNALKEISKSRLVIMSSHDKEAVEDYSDVIIELDYGKVTNVKQNNQVEEININYPNYKKTGIKEVYKLSGKILSIQKFRRLFTCFFFLISLTMTIVSFVCFNFDKSEYFYKGLKEHNSIVIIGSDDSESGVGTNIINEYDISKLNEESYESCKFFKYYFEQSDESIDEVLTVKTKTSDVSDKSFLSNMVVYNNIDDNEIVITDYIAYKLINHGKIAVNSIDECINKTITIRDTELKIKNITKTRYEWYINLAEDNKKKNLTYYHNDLNNIKMNQTTFNNVCADIPRYYEGKLNEERIEIFDSNSIHENNVREGKGRLPENSNEIMLSSHFLPKGTSINDDISEFIGKKESFKISNLEEKEFTIVGFMDARGSKSVCFSSDYYKETVRINDAYYIPYEEYRMVEIGNEKDTIKLINDLDKDDAYLTSFESGSLLLSAEEIIIIKKISKYIFIVSSILLLAVSYYFSTNLIKSNKKELGILTSLGLSKKHSTLMFTIDILKTYLISFVFANILYIIYMLLFNNANKFNYNLEVNVLNFNILIILIVFVVTLLIIGLSLLLPIFRLNKKDIKEVIYE